MIKNEYKCKMFLCVETWYSVVVMCFFPKFSALYQRTHFLRNSNRLVVLSGHTWREPSSALLFKLTSFPDWCHLYWLRQTLRCCMTLHAIYTRLPISNRISMPYWMWLLRPWTCWITLSGSRLWFFSTQTLDKVSKPWDRGWIQHPTKVLESYMIKPTSLRKRVHIFLQVSEI